MRSWQLFLAPLLLVGLPAALPAQPAQPPAPANFRVKLRYDIRAGRDQHVALYDALVAHLGRLGFAFEPPLEDRPNTDREDPTKDRLEGAIPPAKALKTIDNPSVAAVLLVPDDFKLPDEADKPVHVRLQLASGFLPDRQRELGEQVLVLLKQLGFREDAGYDRRGYDGRPYSRLAGTIPRGKLELLLKDLRNQPTGWLAPVLQPEDLPGPLRDVNPVRVIEVLRDAEPPAALGEPAARATAALDKISPELWEIVSAKEEGERALRVQVVFAGTVAGRAELVRTSAPGFFVEGELGQYVTGLGTATHVKTLAALPGVVAVRLPQPARTGVDAAVKPAGDNARALAQSGAAELHRRGYRGQGVRLAVLDTDFRGWQALVKDGKLPAKTRLVDLTTENSPEILTAPEAGDADQPGHGTLCAQAAALAAPAAELTLVRLDGTAPYQLREVLRYQQGGYLSPLADRRRDELSDLRSQLAARRETLLRERREVLEDFTDDTDLRQDYGFLGPIFGWVFSEREWHRQRMAEQDRLEAALRRRDERFAQYVQNVETLRGIQVVTSPLVWQNSYPPGAASALSRQLDNQQRSGPFWFQAVGDARGQSWLGPFRTLADGASLLFADSTAALPAGRWTRELNFLAWQPHQGDAAPELPEKARVRATLRWREPHDPAYYLPPGENDPYQKSLATLRLMLLRQRDPEAKALPADAFEIVSRSPVVPLRLEHTPASSLYELTLDVTLDKPGRYALGVERQGDTQWVLVKHPTRPGQLTLQQLRGLNPIGTRPLGMPALTGVDRDWELRPQLGVEVIDDASRRLGRVVLGDFRTDAGEIGVPADARGVAAVGAVDLNDRPRPASAHGSPMLAELARLPLVWSYDALELAGGGAVGSSVAAAHAAGLTAALMSSGLSRAQVAAWLHAQPGQVLRVPGSAAKR